MPTVALSDVEIHYEERGEGAPLLLVAGIPAIASDWAPLAERLATTRRVIAYDNRGSGGSTVTPGPYTTAQLAEDAVALLDHLGIERSDVFGMSLGGMISQELALRHPERVACLALGCTHADFAHAVQPSKETSRAFAMQTDDWGARMRALAPLAFTREVDTSLLERFTEKKSRDVQDPAGYQAQIDAVLHHDALDRLAAIRAPTLVVTGDDDRIIPGVNSEALAQRIPGARLEVIGGAGHLFFLERPDRTVAVLEDFLDRSGTETVPDRPRRTTATRQASVGRGPTARRAPAARSAASALTGAARGRRSRGGSGRGSSPRRHHAAQETASSVQSSMASGTTRIAGSTP